MLAFPVVKGRGGMEQEHNASLLALFSAAQPMLLEGVDRVLDLSLSRVGNVNLTALDLIDYHKVPLVPVDDARKRRLFFELLPRKLGADGPKANVLGRLADAEQGDPLAVDPTFGPECVQGIISTVMVRHHPKASRPAVHLVMLSVNFESTHQIRNGSLIGG